jgi:hypothetical protein
MNEAIMQWALTTPVFNDTRIGDLARELRDATGSDIIVGITKMSVVQGWFALQCAYAGWLAAGGNKVTP